MCIFCMAAIMMIGASLSAVALGNMETRLALTSGVSEVKRSVDTGSTVVWKANVTVKVPGRRTKQVAVTIHLYKQHQRMRIQILTHDISPVEAQAVQDLICTALDARIISRHFPEELALTDKDLHRQTVVEPRKARQDAQKQLRRKP